MAARSDRRSLGALGIAVLALLVERPMHPYEMFQTLLQRGEERLLKVRPGSLYHTVDRLEHAGLVHAAGTEREGNRPERTTYEITVAGRGALTDRITEILGTPDREYPLFPVALGEAHNLPADDVVGLLRKRIAAREADVAELDEYAARARAKHLPRVFWFEAEYLRRLAEAERGWLDELVGEIESGTLPWMADYLDGLHAHTEETARTKDRA